MAWMVILLLAGAISTRAAIPFAPSLRDYVHTAWTHHDGTPLSSIHSITQTTDGYLWIATSEEGLLRFDGVRFVRMESPCERPSLVTQAVSDRAGGLWLTCDRRVFHRDASGKTVPVQQTILPPDLYPAMPLYVDRHGNLWLWGPSLGYLRPDGSEGGRIRGVDRPSGAMSCQFAEDSDGNLWFASLLGLHRIAGGAAERVLAVPVTDVAPSRSGGVLAIEEQTILHVRVTAARPVMSIPPSLHPNHSEIMKQTDLGIWLGTRDHGIALIRTGGIETMGAEHGLSSNAISEVFVDREGTVWVGTHLGLHRFRRPLAYLLSNADGVPQGLPEFVFHDSRGGRWIGTNVATSRVGVDGRSETIRQRFTCLEEDRSGRIWASTTAEIGYLDRGRFVNVRDAQGAPIQDVFTLKKDREGELWALSGLSGLYRLVGARAVLEVPGVFDADLAISGRDNFWAALRKRGLLRRANGNDTTFGPHNGVPFGSIYAIYPTNDAMWVATSRGLHRLRNGVWTHWSAEHGFPGRSAVFEIAEDAHGRFWLMTDGGILALRRAQLDQTPDGQPRSLSYLRIGSLDRVMPHRGGMRPSPRVSKDRDGRLYFLTQDSVAMVDPAQIQESSFVPSIVLENVLVNRRPVAGNTARFVKPDEVQFEYTSLSLRNPENIRFRYLLEGYDKTWIEAGTERRAGYSNLPPGAYRFRVVGSGSESVWNERGAAFAFQIAAPFYQSSWFFALGALLAATLVWLVYRYQVRLTADRIRVRMEAQAGERLRIAQDMHDTFLQGIQGSALMIHAAAEQLESEPAETRRLLQRALHMVERSTDEARKMLMSLRSEATAKEPLATRIEMMARQAASVHPNPPKVQIEFTGPARDLRPPVDEDVCHIASEALTNALRHAQAREVQLAIQFAPKRFQMVVADDGVGIEPETRDHGRPSHFGLPGMRERAERHGGVLEIDCRKGGGTEVRLSLAGESAYQPATRQ